MLHLQKLAVGVRDLEHLRSVQAARLSAFPPLRHHTRSRPRRGGEIANGGSIYWVIAGAMLARQRVLRLEPGQWDDGTPATALVLDPVLVPVMPRTMRPFQGWRYMRAEDAPSDVTTGDGLVDENGLPPRLRGELRDLGLI